MAENNLTGADIAALAGVKPRTARCWIQPCNQSGARAIPWAAWAMIQLLTNKKSKDDFLHLINSCKKEAGGRGLFEKGIVGRPQR